MKPVHMVLAISQNLLFHGPGVTSQGVTSFISDFVLGSMLPTLVDIQQNGTCLLGMHLAKGKKQYAMCSVPS